MPPKPNQWRPARRQFLRSATAGLSLLGGMLSGCSLVYRGSLPAPDPLTCTATPGSGDDYDYIVIGSGAGGGPVAARLARAGFKVLVLEAGGDEDSYDYEVPAFHTRASENPDYAWNFFVRHYADEKRQARDTKYTPEQRGVLYPRAATVGGCTAHNAMILVYPNNSDWDHIAQLTGDASWSAESMHKYFARMERCQYVSPGDEASGHGYTGWLPTDVADPQLMRQDSAVAKMVAATALESAATPGAAARFIGKLGAHLDPNDWRLVQKPLGGIYMTPLTTQNGRRRGSREYLRAVRDACPGKLVIRTHTLVTRILLDENKRASAVECLAGRHLYRADPNSASAPAGEKITLRARREIILAAGAFNTPQLLKLSGIGPENELKHLGIPLQVELPGVGENLQDRYEITVVSRMKENFSLLKGMQFHAPAPGEAPDPQFAEWLQGKGPYTTNGAVVAFMKRSAPDLPQPDLFLFGLTGYFKGYFPGYSQQIARGENYFTWAILKAHTHNHAGRVLLRSTDPRDTPYVNFHYFDEGTPGGDDLDAVMEGVETVRKIAAKAGDIVAEEVLPGPNVSGKAVLRDYIRDNAWGHHASCSCRMGPAGDRMAVVDSRFRVFGTRGLRIVDASVFPRIPGYFIVSAVYMIGEKAADAILEDAAAQS
ncbi:MAG: GMC family oxidoreductase [Rhodocyclaceae bacterium]|nr:GMC family oxidoreductase [Rhodocyclaceae bacterium]